MNSFLIAWRNIVRDAQRSMATVLIIAVGLTALLLGSGFMLATYDSLQEIAKRSEGHVVVLSEQTLPLGGTHQQLVLNDWQQIADELWMDERVLQILPRARFEGLISHKENSAAFFGSGVDPKSEFRVHGPFLRTKGVLDPWLAPEAMADVVLGTQLAKTLKASTGDVLTLHSIDHRGQAQTLKVQLAGTYHTGAPEIDDHSLMISLNTLATLLATDNVSQLSIYLNNAEDAKAFTQQVKTRLDQVTLQTWHQRAELYDKVKSQYDRIFGVMGVIVLAVVFLAISNTIALAIYQRREEIATLSALGTPPLRICGHFIVEALLIGLIATSIGMLAAYLLSASINMAELMMPPPPGRTEGYPIIIYISWPYYFATSAILVAIVTLASSLSSLKATRINIRKAL